MSEKMNKIQFLSTIEVADKNDNNKNIFVVDQETGNTSGRFAAEDVFFTENFSITEKFGSYGPQDGSNNSTECDVVGKSVAEFIKSAFTKIIAPTITSEPSVSVSTISNRWVESGTTIAPNFSISTNPGAYSDGTVPQISFYGYYATDGKDVIQSQSGTFTEQIITKDNPITVFVQAYWGDDTARPKDNEGTVYDDVYIKAGDDEASYTIDTYLGCFYGITESEITIDSTNIRDLKSAIQGAHTNYDDPTNSFTSFKINNPWKHFYIAVPAISNIVGLRAIRNDNSMLVANIDEYDEIDVADARGNLEYTNKYRVFHISNTIAYEAVTLKFTWKK